ncbi:MAG: IPTL-CTERM sorting domain-containing protein [Nitrospirae bacterium]|nr:MAG: IPTL-CTERM sorting domain-containing protein [Nitrospirota bacterium]
MGADEYRAASVVTSVPTMNEWGLVFFAVLAGCVALMRLRGVWDNGFSQR